jgi:hypothetical protein
MSRLRFRDMIRSIIEQQQQTIHTTEKIIIYAQNANK